ncbi:serine protease [Arenibacter sp. N53]|uniref:trypsin-like serine peptidase n=1 Tax=Arenibacter TaxID=178469 RepID=UPI000CD48B48|nr:MULTISPECIES: serine protease [Arenibacter]MCM4150909.1 serine protease [Arenibacter sp. N53]
MKEDKSKHDGSKRYPDLDPPFSYERIFKEFNQSPTGKIPKDLEAILLPEPKPYKFNALKADRNERLEVASTVPMMPSWFGQSPLPERAISPIVPKISMKGREANPLTMFNPEDRRIYNDLSYPWGTICRVVTAAGAGSGVIVGPRHVVTASHVVDWSGNSGGTVEVHRSGATVRASTAISNIWYYTKVTGTVDWFEQDEDYAVLVTSQRIGDLFGWMGTRTYNSAWDNEPYWWNIGYPGSIGSGIRPTYQRNAKLNEPWYDLGPARSMSTRADLTPGNSGGPMFGFWSNGPYVVAVASSETSSENWCAGGSWLTNLVRHAINQNP